MSEDIHSENMLGASNIEVTPSTCLDNLTPSPAEEGGPKIAGGGDIAITVKKVTTSNPPCLELEAGSQSEDSFSEESSGDDKNIWLGVWQKGERKAREKDRVRPRVVNSLRYSARLENRVTRLENELREMGGDAVQAHRLKNQVKQGKIQAAIVHMNWKEWQPKPAPRFPNEFYDQHGWRPDPTDGYVLEVLNEEPPSPPRDHEATTLTHEDLNPTIGTSDREVFTSRPRSSQAPPRLRIRSSLLLEILKMATDSPQTTRGGKLTYLRPYKVFVLHEQQIRQRFKALSDQYSDNSISEQTEINGVHDEIVMAAQSLNIASVVNNENAVDQNPTKEEMMSRTAYEHMKLFMSFMDEDLKGLLALRRRIENLSAKTIAFDDLWHLFKVGQEVVVPSDEKGGIALYKVLVFTGGRDLGNDGRAPLRPAALSLGPGNWYGAFAVQCWSFAFDGDMYCPVAKTFAIRRYEGEQDITSLPIYPFAFHPDNVEVREQLTDRGRAFIQFASKKSTHRRYIGPNLDENARGGQINSEVIIDFQEAFDSNETWRPHKINLEEDKISFDTRELKHRPPMNIFCRWFSCCTGDMMQDDFVQDNINLVNFVELNRHMFESKKDLENVDEVVLLPDRVFAYLLVNRKWAILSMSLDRLQSAKSYDPWNDLVLPVSHKETVEALVRQHLKRTELGVDYISAHERQGDFIAGKGAGLVFLLHGPPGTGKTSTAECIAAHVGKPLYSLTSGNLGVRPDIVEENLQRQFAIAEKWGCLLLLDEADVFLQRRVPSQININAIVSVFLRQLEYYNGILFLTTNRVGDIDPAFRSRIHVTLEYKPLDQATTLEIYKRRLARICEDFESRHCKPKPKVKTEDILEWAKQHFDKNAKKRRQWNGRQIHNAFQTAMALAEWDSRPAADGKENRLTLRKKHFQKVSIVAEGFDQYMLDLFGQDEPTRARVNLVRLDYSKQNGHRHFQLGQASSQNQVPVHDRSFLGVSGGYGDAEEDDNYEEDDKREKIDKSKLTEEKGEDEDDLENVDDTSSSSVSTSSDIDKI